MVLRFLCPNGHKIHCPDEHAGRAGKCPDCGVKFRIPQLSEFDSFASDATDAASAVLTDSGIGGSGSRIELGASGRDRHIDFLCPHGHRLHSPASLQGRPGECPECGAKFRIPTYETPDESAVATRGHIVRGRADGRDDSSLATTQDEQPPKILKDGSVPLAHGERSLANSALASTRRPPSTISTASPAELFADLWEHKPAGGKVELRLANGDSLLPDCFSKTLSKATHGVFATRQPDGLYTLHAIAWRDVAQMLVRNAKDLPRGMAE